ncbi:MAG: PEP-CTERM sorting domain-containing protein [Rhodanobacteraceae bacterium]
MASKMKWLLAALVLFGFSAAAQASIIPIGSSMTFGGSNLPGACTDTSCSDTVTFTSTPVLIDGGALSLYETQTADGPNAEWDVWHITTVGGGPLAGDINAYWQILLDYELSDAVNFTAVVDQWTVNGTPVTPLSNFGGICCAVGSNPSPISGEAYYNSGFSVPLSAGVQSNWDQIYVSPYSFVSAGGIDPSTANGFSFGLLFTLQHPTSVPEPTSLGLFGFGALLIGLFVGLRRRFD